MKKTKALLGFLIGVAIIGSSFTSTVANAAVKNAQSQTNVVINNSKTKAAPVKVKSSKISNRLTLNQLINEYASDQKVSVNEAKKALGVENSINVESIASPNSRGEFYRTYAITLEVNDDEYEPEIKFYCKTSIIKY